MNDRTANQQCTHPADQIQSGIYALGVYEVPVCMACGEQLKSVVEIIVSQEIDNG